MGQFVAILAGLTNELHFHQEKCLWIHSTYLASHQASLSRFINVTTLVFTNLVISISHMISLEECFGAFARGVRNLRLYRPVARPISLVYCILSFPTAVNIDISYPQWAAIEERDDLPPPPPEGVRFTGMLHLRGFMGRWPKFFELLSAQSIKFQKTRLIGCDFQNPIPVQSLLVATSNHVRTLHLAAAGSRE